MMWSENTVLLKSKLYPDQSLLLRGGYLTFLETRHLSLEKQGKTVYLQYRANVS